MRCGPVRLWGIMAALVLLMAAGCSRPRSMELFAAIGEPLEVDLSDSLCTYDLSLYTRADFPVFGERPDCDIPLDLTLVSPSGKEYGERVFFPTGEPLHSSFFTSDFLAPWRTGCVPSEYGVWTLTVHVKDLDWEPVLRGFGLVVERCGKKEL